jgi:SAM-dependent methyltransferase/uncharacterized membrane protein YbhN (UPF0104 family)
VQRRPRLLLYLLPLLVGGVVAALWVRATGGAGLARGLLSASPAAIALALALTATWLFVRFIRWQFLLRRVGVRIPIRTSLGSYLGALPGTATPAYVGEAIRAVFLRRRFGVPMRVTVSVLVLERLYDVAALAIIALATARDMRLVQIGVAFLALAFAVAAMLWPIARRIGIAEGARARVRSMRTVILALGLSVVAWGAASLLVAVAARGLGVAVGVLDGVRVFVTSTLLGAITLLPAGFGATGSVQIVELTALGVTVASAVLVVSLVRLTSTGAALTVGAVFLWRELRSGRGDRPAEGAAHFDAIADEYNAQWSPHVWDLLLDRKLGFLAGALPSPPKAAGLGLDLGCGLGLQTAALRKRGFDVIGIDPSYGLLAAGRSRTGVSAVAAGSALELPFRDGSLDFVYTIGVLHHLPGRDAQTVAYREIARVLKPGGVLLIHESNPRNPLFRFYMGYLFPILKSIDEGTEWWIDPRSLADCDGLDLESVRYFTFLPDFTPRAVMGPALAFERLLERGPTKPFSAHYMAVLRRTSRPMRGSAAAHAGSSNRTPETSTIVSFSTIDRSIQ